jgi:hypothetical protein
MLVAGSGPVQSVQLLKSTSPRAPCQRFLWIEERLAGQQGRPHIWWRSAQGSGSTSRWSVLAEEGHSTREAQEDPEGGRRLREDRRRGLKVLELNAAGREDDVAGDVDGVLLTGVQGADLVFVHQQGAVVSGVRFTVHQRPGLIDGAGGQNRIREGEQSHASGGRSGGEAEQTGCCDEKGGGGAGEGVGRGIAFGGISASGVSTHPGDALNSGTADLPVRGVKFEADGAAEFVEARSTDPMWSPEGVVRWAT